MKSTQITIGDWYIVKRGGLRLKAKIVRALEPDDYSKRSVQSYLVAVGDEVFETTAVMVKEPADKPSTNGEAPERKVSGDKLKVTMELTVPVTKLPELLQGLWMMSPKITNAEVAK